MSERQNMEIVYVVYGGELSEHAALVNSFEDASDAESFAQSCREYKDRCPVPTLHGSEEQYAIYWAEYTTWKENHPAGPDCVYDYYTVEQIPFYGKGKPCTTNK
jgi:hypothetical protein